MKALQHQPFALQVSFFFILLPVIIEAQDAVRETEKTCSAKQTCLPVTSCLYYQKKSNKIKSGEFPKESQEWQDLVKKLKNEVCNKDESAFCCPCDYGDVCMPSSQCEYAQDKISEHKRLKLTDRFQAKIVVEELKGRICDREDNQICCPALPRLDDSCGINQINLGNVVGGEDSRVGEFPWAALLGTVREKTTCVGRQCIKENVPRWSCGGVLINTRFVLTAAHCQGRRKQSQITKLRLGEWCVSGDIQCVASEPLPPVQDLDIEEGSVKVHEDYSTKIQNGIKNIVNDIALIRLPKAAELNRGVYPACLPHIPTEYREELGVGNLINDIVGMRPTVVGWGYKDVIDPWSDKIQGDTEEYGVASRRQQKLALPVLSPSDCATKYNGLVPLDSQICAGGEKGKDSCKGDSGGGLFIQDEHHPEENDRPWYLIGIVSFGSSTCGDGRPGIYTRVSHYLPWIKDNIWNMSDIYLQ